MRLLRLASAVAALAAVLALAACGSGGRSADVALLVTSDYGAKVLDDVTPGPVEGGPTLLEYLRANDAATADAVARGGWHVYLNGVGGEDPAKTKLHGGDRVWWDRHAGGAGDPRAVIGSYPEPFLQGVNGKRWPTRVECVRGGDKASCDAIAKRLGEAGVVAAQALTGTEGGEENVRVLVGPWAQIRGDRSARLVDEGPRASGVFARFSDDGSHVQLLDAAGHVTSTAGPGTGLIAATRYQDEPPTWFVTGTDAAGVAAAVQAFDEGTLGNRFALAIVDDQGKPLPISPVE